MNGYVVIEGHGEVEAINNLLTRLAADLELPAIHWRKPFRRALTSERAVGDVCDVLRRRSNCDCLLVLRDEDDGCPKHTGPELARWIAKQKLPFPSAATLLHREYEVLFLPCIEDMAGKPLATANISRPGLAPGTTFSGNPEQVRDVKGWLSDHFPDGRRYRPTTDQLPLTRLIEFARVRDAGLPCFGTLERCLQFLSTGAAPGSVYP